MPRKFGNNRPSCSFCDVILGIAYWLVMFFGDGLDLNVVQTCGFPPWFPLGYFFIIISFLVVLLNLIEFMIIFYRRYGFIYNNFKYIGYLFKNIDNGRVFSVTHKVSSDILYINEVDEVCSMYDNVFSMICTNTIMKAKQIILDLSQRSKL